MRRSIHCTIWADEAKSGASEADRDVSRTLHALQLPAPVIGVSSCCMSSPRTAEGGDQETAHAYPRELAVRVTERWAELSESDASVAQSLPPLPVLERILSTCYQASLSRDEGRPTTFRLAFGERDYFAARRGPPRGLHRLVFSELRPLEDHELRRLAPAASFHRSLIAAGYGEHSTLQIWGLVHSGPRWLQAMRGGRDVLQIIPAVLMVAVSGPGRLLVSLGASATLGELSGGELAGAAMDVFRAKWFGALFTISEAGQRALYGAEREQRHATWSELKPGFGTMLTQHVLRRIVATIRAARHGGTLILVPSREVADSEQYIALKYRFENEEPRRRFLTLSVRIMAELAKLNVSETAEPVGWSEYETASDPRLATLDEALFEVAHLVASLAGVDGAVVMTADLELLGFGAEISGALPAVSKVARAIDLDGTNSVWESTDRVGTRHRSVYRLCNALAGALAIVVSQDGGVRFVRSCAGCVMYWDQVANAPWEA